MYIAQATFPAGFMMPDALLHEEQLFWGQDKKVEVIEVFDSPEKKNEIPEKKKKPTDVDLLRDCMSSSPHCAGTK
eukprot:12409048-Karenia_brevis.AAC.1